MRIQLLIDIETDDIPRLRKVLAPQPAIPLNLGDNWNIWGRLVGAKEAINGLQDPAMMDPYDRQAERERRK